MSKAGAAQTAQFVLRKILKNEYDSLARMLVIDG